MFAFAPFDSAGESVAGLIRWAGLASLLDATSGGSPVADGGLVARWLAEDDVTALDQATSGKRPTADLAALPGRPGVRFDADKNLAGPLPAFQGAILIVVGPQSGSRTLVSRDTSQVTTAPAFSVAVEEYF